MRSGLISAVAILTILFVASTIFAIYYGVQAGKSSDEEDRMRLEIASVATNPNADEVREFKQDPDFGGRTTPAINTASLVVKALVHQITGGDKLDEKGARDAAATAIGNAQKNMPAGVQLPQDLDGALGMVTQQLVTARATIDTLNNDKSQDKAALLAEQKKSQAQIAALQLQVSQAMADKQKAIDASMAQQAAKDAQIDALAKNAAAERATLQSQTEKINAAYNDLKTQVDLLKRQVIALGAKLAGNRVDVRQAVIDQSDGQIVSVTSDNIAYINLGIGDHIAPGQTFEVYDGRLPLPKLPNLADNETMPVGKGSIEVIRVANGASQCRIIATQNGQNLSPGDKILNLVYDRNTKYNFVVYGDFDINNTGKAVPQDAQVIKRLVTQWGGTVKDQITPETDFVIMGKEPEVPQFTADELKDPFNKKKYDDANAAADKYDDEAKQAQDLSVPILNQNRFLYYVGYYDTVGR